MADVSPAGQVLEKTTRTRIIPAESHAQAPDFWEYIERQKLPDPDHIMYLYSQKDNRNIPYGQYTSHFELRDGRLVPIDDREALEQAIQSRFGGGMWRLILKHGRQRICETRLFTGDAPTLPPPLDQRSELQPIMGRGSNGGGGRNGNGFNHLTPLEDGTAQIANKAIDTIANQEHQAVNLGLGMMTTAADVMKRFAEHSTNPAAAPPPAGPEADLRNALTQALVARLAMDPMQQLAQTMAFVRELTGSNGAGNGNGGVGRQMEEFRSILTFARELVGGAASSGPAASTAGAIVNVLPGIVSAGVDIARAWQVGKEAERDTVAMATAQARPAGRPAGPVIPGQVPLSRSPFDPPPRPVLPPSAPAAPAQVPVSFQPPAGAGPGNIVPPSTEFIEAKIVELFQLPIPAEDSASRALEFLYTLSGPNPAVSYVTQLTVLGETGLVNLFHMRPTLKRATEDMGRLLEFIRAFLKFSAEEEAIRAKQQKPN